MIRQRADNQKGFTLLEVILIIAIVGALAPVLSLSIIQVIRGTDRNNTMVVALADIERAAHFINQDLSMAKTITLALGQTKDLLVGDNVTLNWTDYYGGNATAHQSQYTLSGTNLTRDYDYGQVVANIAVYISGAEFSRDLSGELVTFTLTSSPEGVSGGNETRTYRVYRRTE